MKKFTTFVTALMLGGIGFSALAAETTITPTISPEQGTILMCPNYIIISWEGEEVSLNPQSPLYQPRSKGSEDYVLNLSVTLDGEKIIGGYGEDVGEQYAPAYPAAYVVTEWSEAWERAEDGNEATALMIELPYVAEENGEWIITLPENSVFIGEGKDTNAAEVLKYNVFVVPNEVTTVPSTGSSIFSLSEIELTWDVEGVSIEGINPDSTDKITYGACDWFGTLTDAEEVKDVVCNNGVLTIILGEDYDTVGQVGVEIPAGYLMLNTEIGTYPNAQNITLTYTITEVATYPGSYKTMWGPVKSFLVYATKSIEFVGDLEEPMGFYPDDDDSPIDITISEVKNTTYNGYPALEFILETPCNGSEMNITIPAESLKVNGKEYEQDLYLTIYIYPAAEIEPVSGTKLSQIDAININWGAQEMEINKSTSATPTLTYNGLAIDISDYMVIENIVVGEDTGMDHIPTIPTLIANFSENPFTAPGEYTLTIPAGYAYFASADLYNEEITATYTVENNNATYISGEMTVDPASGSKLASLGYITVEFADTDLYPGDVNLDYIEVTVDGESIEFSDFDSATVANIVESDDSGIGVMEDTAGSEVAPVQSKSILSMYFWISQKGEVSITVKEGALLSTSGAINKAFTLNYSLLEIAGDPSWNPVSGEAFVEGELVATATWANETLALNPSFDGEVNLSMNEESLLDATKMIKVENNSLVCDFTSLKEADYELIIPEGYLLVGTNNISGDVIYKFTIDNTSGVSSIESVNGVNAIYNLQGVKVNENNLKSGIYIINGKKVMIRK